MVLFLDGLGCKFCNVLVVEKYFLLLVEVNLLVNVVVYSCRDVEMRRIFRRFFCCFCFRRFIYEFVSYIFFIRIGFSIRIMFFENGYFLMDFIF